MSSPSPASKRTGRRPGSGDTREAIALAARDQFAELGYDRATMRKIAAVAGVDPAMVVHFYGSKESLFREVMALPPIVADALGRLAEGDRSTVGRRLAETVVAALENPVTRSIVIGRIRSASSHPEAAELVRETVARDILRIAHGVGTDHPELRASLAGTHVVAIAFARYIVKIEPLADLDPAELVDLIAPDFQRWLVEPLSQG